MESLKEQEMIWLGALLIRGGASQVVEGMAHAMPRGELLRDI
jgi:hypothetical protein